MKSNIYTEFKHSMRSNNQANCDKVFNYSFIDKLSIFTMIFLGAIYILSLLELAIGVGLIKYNIIFAIIVSGFICSLIFDKILKIIPIFGTLIIFFTIISAYFFDYSWDGQTYHQTAIIALFKGWNPFFEINPLTAINIPSISENGNVDIWIKHYPKSNWILSVNFYNLTNNIETGKTINFLYATVAFGFLYSFLSKFTKFGTKFNILFSLILTLTPITFAQMLTFYVDNSLYNLIVILTISLLIYIKYQNKTYMLLSLIVLALLINIKFTGLIYSIAISSIIFFSHTIYTKKINTRYIKFMFYGIIFSTFILGYNPYFTNLLQGKPLLYPVFGKGKMDVIGWQIDKNFHKQNQLKKMFCSYFSKPTNSKKYPEPQFDYQILLPSAYKNMGYDTRINGFGSIFPILLLLSILFFLLNLKEVNSVLFSFALITPDGHLKIPHLWPGQNPPPSDSRTVVS